MEEDHLLFLGPIRMAFAIKLIRLSNPGQQIGNRLIFFDEIKAGLFFSKSIPKQVQFFYQKCCYKILKPNFSSQAVQMAF